MPNWIGSSQAYNVSSGMGVSVRQLATDILLRAGMSPDISSDASLSRSTDIPVLIAGGYLRAQVQAGLSP